MKFPKIELHVHLEGTVRAGTLLQIARRNGVPLPADSVEGLAALYEFRDFAHFLDVWLLTTGALRTERDFRQIVVDYAAEAVCYGAVCLEGIFTPRCATGRPGMRSSRPARRSTGLCYLAAWPPALGRSEVRGERASGPARAGRPGRNDQARSNRSRFITLSHAATKSFTNFSFASSLA